MTIDDAHRSGDTEWKLIETVYLDEVDATLTMH